MKVWIATHEEDHAPSEVIGVHASEEGAKALCAADCATPLDWSPREHATEGSVYATTSRISSYEVAPYDLGLDRDGDYGRLLAVTSIVGEADDQADLSAAVVKALTPA